MLKCHKPKIIAISIIALLITGTISYVNYLMGIPLDMDMPKEFTYNGAKIALAWTDDNTGETLIIQSDKKEYSGFNSVDVYFSVTNINKRDQDMDVVVWVENEKVKVEEILKIQTAVASKSLRFVKANRSDLEATAADRKNIGGSSSGYFVNDQIVSGQTNYYKAIIKYPPMSNGEFFIEAFGGEKEAKPLRFALANRRGLASSAYGHLDPWYASDWSYRKRVDINADQVMSNETDFPILATTTDTDLIFTGNGGNVASSTREAWKRLRNGIRH